PTRCRCWAGATAAATAMAASARRRPPGARPSSSKRARPRRQRPRPRPTIWPTWMTTFRSDGIRLCAAQAASGQRLAAETGKLRSWLASYGFEPFLCPQQGDGPSGAWAGYGVQGPVAARWAPGHDTTGLGVALGLDIWGSDRDLER